MKKISKIIYIITFLYMAASVIVTDLIRFRFMIIIFGMLWFATIMNLGLKYAVAISVAMMVVILEYLGFLPLPFNYLTNHGMYMSGAIVITLLAAFAYVATLTALSYIFAVKISSVRRDK